jgi:hypothetical protein
MDLMISKLVVKGGRIEKSETLNISFNEWKSKVEESKQVHYGFELGDWAPKGKYTFAAILSKVHPNYHASLIYNDFWFIIRVSFPDKLEHEFIPIVADFAESFGAHLLISDTKMYPKEKIEAFREKAKNTVYEPKERYQNESFGEGSAWLAVKGVGMEDVFRKLSLKKEKEADWEGALKASYSNHFLVTPLINGWVFIHGFELPRHIHQLFGHLDTESEPFNSIIKVVEMMSEGGGNAQFYMNKEKSSITAGFMAVSGKLDFGFLKSEAHDYQVGNIEKITAVSESLSPLQIAGEFSVDPTALVYEKELKDIKVVVAIHERL